MTDLTRFLICWPNTLAQECPFPKDWSNPRNFSNDPYDPGGATMDGIIQAEYNAYCRSHNLPETSVRDITQPQGQDIYLNNFWLPHCPLCPPGLDQQVFDANVNEGVKESTRILQVALGLNNDGVWGPETATAVAAITNPAKVIIAFTARRKAVYRMTNGFDRFGTDWLRRATQIGDQSLAMTSGPHLVIPMLEEGQPFKRVPRAMWFIEGAAA